MHTQKYSLRSYFTLICFTLICAVGCNKEADTDAWQETKDIVIIAYKSDPDPVTHKEYLNIIYENIGKDTYQNIKYEVFLRTGTKTDTLVNTILPTTVFVPKDKRLVPRHIGEEEAKFDEVKVGKIWVVKDEAK